VRVRDFFLLMLICLIWAFNNVLSKIIVDNWAVPPLFYAGLRFAVVALMMLPWLLPMPRPAWRILLIGLLMGGGNFALLFMALRTTSPSSAAIVVQLGVPFTILLSMLMLDERIHWRRGLGIALTVAGVLIVVWRPGGLALSAGLWLVAAAAFAGSLGAILMKQVEAVSPFRFQAWVGLSPFSSSRLHLQSSKRGSGRLRRPRDGPLPAPCSSPHLSSRWARTRPIIISSPAMRRISSRLSR
jgi:drug/metabolite transporter (DMT)-like permease